MVGLALAALLLALDESQLGGDLLMDDPRLVGLVGGTDQVDGHLRFDGRGTDALATWGHLRGSFQEVGSGLGQARPYMWLA